MAVDAAELEEHRTALTGHCYRMLGSAFDAEDAVQETMIRAWRGLERFDGRASLKTWLYRIATNVCIDSYSDRARRIGPTAEGVAGKVGDTLEKRPRAHWIEPIPDEKALPAGTDPAQLATLRQSIRLAFVAALQHLPPKQRAALIMTEVLGWSVAEVAESVETSVPAINSALQRARATLALRDPKSPIEATNSELVDDFMKAFEAYDVDRLTNLLSEDAKLSMPPYTLWLEGHADIAAWLTGPGNGCRGSRLVPLAASGASAFGQYRDGGKTPWAVVVLTTSGNQITHMTYFLDVEKLFPLFALPPQLGA